MNINRIGSTMSPLSHPHSRTVGHGFHDPSSATISEISGRRPGIHNSSAQTHSTSEHFIKLGSTDRLSASCHHGDISRESIPSYSHVHGNISCPTKICPKRSMWSKVLAAALFVFILKELLLGSYSRYSSLCRIDIGKTIHVRGKLV